MYHLRRYSHLTKKQPQSLSQSQIHILDRPAPLVKKWIADVEGDRIGDLRDIMIDSPATGDSAKHGRGPNFVYIDGLFGALVEANGDGARRPGVKAKEDVILMAEHMAQHAFVEGHIEARVYLVMTETTVGGHSQKKAPAEGGRNRFSDSLNELRRVDPNRYCTL